MGGREGGVGSCVGDGGDAWGTGICGCHRCNGGCCIGSDVAGRGGVWCWVVVGVDILCWWCWLVVIGSKT